MPIRALKRYNVILIPLRHGESHALIGKYIAADPEGLGKVVGLTPLGREQIQAAAKKLLGIIARHPGRKVVVVASDLLRTRQSAEELLRIFREAKIDHTFKIDARFRERSWGKLEGESDEWYEKKWALDRAGKKDKKHGVETVKAVKTRTQRAIRQHCKENPGCILIVVTHGDIASNIITMHKGKPLRQHREVGALKTAGLKLLRPAP